MRTLSYIFMIFIISCNNHPKQISLEPNNENKKQNEVQDTVLIVLPNDTLKYPKDEYINIVNNNPAFFNEQPEDPYLFYACKKIKESF